MCIRDRCLSAWTHASTPKTLNAAEWLWRKSGLGKEIAAGRKREAAAARRQAPATAATTPDNINEDDDAEWESFRLLRDAAVLAVQSASPPNAVDAFAVFSHRGRLLREWTSAPPPPRTVVAAESKAPRARSESTPPKTVAGNKPPHAPPHLPPPPKPDEEPDLRSIFESTCPLSRELAISAEMALGDEPALLTASIGQLDVLLDFYKDRIRRAAARQDELERELLLSASLRDSPSPFASHTPTTSSSRPW